MKKIKVKNIFSLIVLSLLFCGTLQANVNDALIAHYKFEGNVNDSSGNNNHAVLNGSGSSYIDGEDRKAINLNGSSYISTNIDLGKSFTVSVKAKSNLSDWNGYGLLGFSKDVNGFIMNTEVDSKNIAFYIYNEEFVDSSSVTDITKYHSYTFSYNGETGNYLVYIDGVNKESGTNPIARSDTQNVNIQFGRDYDFEGYLNGAIDDIKIYNRALTGGEIIEVYNQPYVNTLESVDIEIGTNIDVNLSVGYEKANSYWLHIHKGQNCQNNINSDILMNDPLQAPDFTLIENTPVNKSVFSWSTGDTTAYDNSMGYSFTIPNYHGSGYYSILTQSGFSNGQHLYMSSTKCIDFYVDREPTINDSVSQSSEQIVLNKVSYSVEMSDDIDLKSVEAKIYKDSCKVEPTWALGKVDFSELVTQKIHTYSFDLSSDTSFPTGDYYVKSTVTDSADKTSTTECKFLMKKYSTASSNDCYTSSNIGKIGIDGKCKDKLIVDKTKLFEIVGNDSIDLSYIFTGQVTDMSELFSGKSVNGDISSWDVSNVTDMKNMFLNSYSFDQNISGWDVSKVTDMQGMFGDNKLDINEMKFNQDISRWNVTSVKNMNYMFYYNNSFDHNLSVWDTPNTSSHEDFSTGSTFSTKKHPIWGYYVPVNKNELQYLLFTQNIDAVKIDTRYITDMSELFKNRFYFNGNISSWNVSNVTNMQGMFHSANSFNQDISSWDVRNVTNMQDIFAWALSFNKNINSWDVSNVENMNGAFYYAQAFEQDLSGWIVSLIDSKPLYFDNGSGFANNDKRQPVWGYYLPKNKDELKDLLFTQNINPEKIDTSKITDMSDLFRDKSDFNGNISGWDVSNVTTMENMFFNAYNFNQDIGDWNVSNVTNMDHMFYYANQFKQDISNWNVSSVKSMNHMFASAIVFNSPLNKWNVSSVNYMKDMFAGADKFNQDISNWDVSNVTDMHGMFYSADIFNQNISSWDVTHILEKPQYFNDSAGFANIDSFQPLWGKSATKECDDIKNIGKYCTKANYYNLLIVDKENYINALKEGNSSVYTIHKSYIDITNYNLTDHNISIDFNSMVKDSIITKLYSEAQCKTDINGSKINFSQENIEHNQTNNSLDMVFNYDSFKYVNSVKASLDISELNNGMYYIQSEVLDGNFSAKSSCVGFSYCNEGNLSCGLSVDFAFDRNLSSNINDQFISKYWDNKNPIEYFKDPVYGWVGKFDGNSSFKISLKEDSFFPDTSKDRSYTLSSWVKPYKVDGENGIIGWGDYGHKDKVNALSISRKQIANYWWNNGLLSNNVEIADRWHHIVATYDNKTHRRTIYLDGEVLNSDNTGALKAPLKNITIGKTYIDEYFKGLMKDLKVYNRALSTMEVKKMYDLGIPKLNLNYGLIAHYDFNGDVNDSSLYGYHGDIKAAEPIFYESNRDLEKGIDVSSKVLFDFSDDPINIKNSTVSFYVKTNDVNFTDNYNGFIKAGNSFSDNEGGSRDYLGLYYYINNKIEYFSIAKTLDYGQDLNLSDQYKHIAITVDDQGVVKVFENGTQIKVDDNVSTTSNATFKYLSVGDISGRHSAKGIIIDELRVYERALNREEIVLLNSYYGKNISSIEKQYFTFDQNDSFNVIDIQNDGNSFPIETLELAVTSKDDSSLFTIFNEGNIFLIKDGDKVNVSFNKSESVSIDDNNMDVYQVDDFTLESNEPKDFNISDQGNSQEYSYDITNDIVSDHDTTLSFTYKPGKHVSIKPLPGLWLCYVEVQKVNEIHSKTISPNILTPVKSPFNLQLLMHMDSSGKLKLLKEVYIMQEKDGNNEKVLVIDEEKIHNYEGIIRRGDNKLSAIRLTTPSYSFKTNFIDLDGQISNKTGSKIEAKEIALSKTDPINPFRHQFHPSHKEGFEILRSFKIKIGTYDIDDPKYGETLLRGNYEETIEGLHIIPIKLSGEIILKNVSDIDTLIGDK